MDSHEIWKKERKGIEKKNKKRRSLGNEPEMSGKQIELNIEISN
jgi:hypothetical protein